MAKATETIIKNAGIETIIKTAGGGSGCGVNTREGWGGLINKEGMPFEKHSVEQQDEYIAEGARD